jgi:hypothetical protein
MVSVERFRSIAFPLLLLLIFSIPFDTRAVVWLLSATDLFILALGAITLYQSLTSQKIVVGSSSLVIFVLLSILVIARFLPGLTAALTVAQAKFIITGLLVIVIHITLVVVIREAADIDKLAKAVILSVVFINVINILQGYAIVTLPDGFARFGQVRSVFGIRLPVKRRAVAFFNAFGAYGSWSALGLGISTAAVWTGRVMNRGRAVSVVVIILIGNYLILQSRSVWIGLAVTVLAVCLIQSYRTGRYSDRCIKPSIVIGALSAPIVIPLLMRGLVQINERSVSSRIEQYMMSFQYIISDPLFGYQYGSILAATGYALHSLYLQILVFSGVVGAATFALLTILLGRRYIQLLTNEKLTEVGAGLAGGLMGVYATALFYPAATSYQFWIVISLAAVYIDMQLINPVPE